MSWRFPPMFSSRNCVVLDLVVRSLICFGLMFMNKGKGPASPLYVWIWVFSIHLLKKQFFLQWLVLAPLLKLMGWLTFDKSFINKCQHSLGWSCTCHLHLWISLGQEPALEIYCSCLIVTCLACSKSSVSVSWVEFNSFVKLSSVVECKFLNGNIEGLKC